MPISVSHAMYTKAKKVLGYWSIMLESKPNGVAQFRSLSRRTAIKWRELNEPPPAPYKLNATAGKAVWR